MVWVNIYLNRIMQTEILIAIVSGVITLFASFFVAMYRSRTEFKKLAKQLEEKYTTSLFEKRLAAYPELFRLVHELSNSIEKKTHTKKSLLAFQKAFDAWVSTSAILLTPATAKVVWRYHKHLIHLLQINEAPEIPEVKWTEIRNIHILIGKMLRAEIGVFNTQPAGTPTLDKPHVKAILAPLDTGVIHMSERFGY